VFIQHCNKGGNKHEQCDSRASIQDCCDWRVVESDLFVFLLTHTQHIHTLILSYLVLCCVVLYCIVLQQQIKQTLHMLYMSTATVLPCCVAVLPSLVRAERAKNKHTFYGELQTHVTTSLRQRMSSYQHTLLRCTPRLSQHVVSVSCLAFVRRSVICCC
jgi:hypothetical protein